MRARHRTVAMTILTAGLLGTTGCGAVAPLVAPLIQTGEASPEPTGAALPTPSPQESTAFPGEVQTYFAGQARVDLRGELAASMLMTSLVVGGRSPDGLVELSWADTSHDSLLIVG